MSKAEKQSELWQLKPKTKTKKGGATRDGDKRDRVLDGVQFEKSFKKGVLNKFGGWFFLGSSNVGLLEVSKAEKQGPRRDPRRENGVARPRHWWSEFRNYVTRSSQKRPRRKQEHNNSFWGLTVLLGKTYDFFENVWFYRGENAGGRITWTTTSFI